jgi:hypothetical protein
VLYDLHDMPQPATEFGDLQQNPANHFKLCFYLAVLHAIQRLSRGAGSWEKAAAQFPFLSGYATELAERDPVAVTGDDACARWSAALSGWESTAEVHLPLRALCESCGFNRAALTLLLTIGLVEEDARFGFLFEYLQGAPGQSRPMQGLLRAWFEDAYSSIRRMEEIGLVRVGNPEAPRSGRALAISSPLWDALRGETPGGASWYRFRPAAFLPLLDSLILPDDLVRQARSLPGLFESGELGGVIVRGPQHNGRRTLMAAIAASLGRGLLEISGLNKPDDERWKMVGPLATLLHAFPVVVLEPGLGETANVPGFEGFQGPIGVVLEKYGGLKGPAVERSLTLQVPMPDAAARRLHWGITLGIEDSEKLEGIAQRFRYTSGNIQRAARLANSYSALEGRTAIEELDIQRAGRSLSRQSIETLARRVNVSGGWNRLALTPQTLSELYCLERRCRHREHLQAVAGTLSTDGNTGVRALFAGPSGTGKTLAAQLLASALNMDLYRLDLSAVVNKYIGETEKNLDQVFARAEELDVMLLLDEGDALLTDRTNVRTANDRYANLETNYLLQRLEAFEGILIVTTNAPDRIDDAFQRRMDPVIEFHPPEAAERWNIWQMHLPDRHTVHPAMLTEVASRCALNGGQIRNAALHGLLLALEDGGVVTSAHLEAAVQREYRKLGAVCPLRRAPSDSYAGGRKFAAP